MANFRSPDVLKRYEYFPFELQNVIRLPANDQFQAKNGYKFSVDSSSDSFPFDWYNGYIEVDFKVEQKDGGGGYAAINEVGTINGAHAMINKINVSFGGDDLVNIPQCNHALNVKKLLYYSDEYGRKIGPATFHYLDTSTHASSQKYLTRVVTHRRNAANNADEAGPMIDSLNPNYNEGFSKRKKLLEAAATNNVVIPLNRFNFFKSFKNQVAPNGLINTTLDLENDDNFIFRFQGEISRYVVTTMRLWVPKLIFNSTGLGLYADQYLRPRTWTFLMEKVESSEPIRSQSGTWRVDTGITKPRHVFIWALNNAKLNSQFHNMFLFNTYNMANARTFTKAQLQLGNSEFYPQIDMNPTSVSKTFRHLLQFNKSFNDFLSSTSIDLKTFQDLYGLLYFDLRNQENELKSAMPKLTFSYTLNDVPNADIIFFALILYEKDVSIDIASGKAKLRV